MTKKKRKSSRQRCRDRKNYGSTYRTETWVPGKTPADDPLPINRPAFRSAFAQVRGWHGQAVRSDERTKRKARLKKKRRELAKIRKQTKRAMLAREGG